MLFNKFLVLRDIKTVIHHKSCQGIFDGCIRGGVEDTKLEAKAKAKDSLSKDRPSRGQGQECSRPRTQAQMFSEKKKFLKNFFRRSPIHRHTQNF